MTSASFLDVHDHRFANRCSRRSYAFIVDELRAAEDDRIDMPEDASSNVWSTIAAVLRRGSIFLVAVGAILLLVGALGAWPWPLIRIAEVAARTWLCVVGSAFCVLGMLLLWRGDGSVDKPRPRDYKIQIFSPENRAKVPTTFQASGIFKKKPPEGMTARIIVYNPNGRTYWPKGHLNFDEREKKWYASVSTVGVTAGENRTLMVVLMTKSGVALCDYFTKVGRDSQNWIGIPTLTSDIITCDSITIRT